MNVLAIGHCLGATLLLLWIYLCAAVLLSALVSRILIASSQEPVLFGHPIHAALLPLLVC
jgi:hypothetical protein